jgi:carboxyl-terminal processing protease
VQSVIPCRTDGGKSAIRLTTAYYYTPKGRLIHGVGLEPDIKVEIGAEEWRRVQMKRMHDENPAAYSDDEKAEYDDAEDRQLERAVDLLKAV